MIRSLYRFLLWLHPLDFREEFGGEMLWIYDEAVAIAGSLPLLTDGVASLARQWFVRSDAWKFGIGILVDAMLLAILLLGPQPAGGPRPAYTWEPSPAAPAHSYRLYLMVAKEPTAAEKRQK
jgi:hypothetical protein